MFEGTIYENQQILTAEDVDLLRSFGLGSLNTEVTPETSESLGEVEWGEVMETLNLSGQAVETPGVVVVRLPEKSFDPYSLKSTNTGNYFYWVVAGHEVLELPRGEENKIRLGQSIGLIDANPALNPRFEGDFIWCQTLGPLEKLISYGVVKDAESLLETTEMNNRMLSMICQNVFENKVKPFLQ